MATSPVSLDVSWTSVDEILGVREKKMARLPVYQSWRLSTLVRISFSSLLSFHALPLARDLVGVRPWTAEPSRQTRSC